MTRPYQIIIDTNVLLTSLRSRQGASFKLLSMLNDTRWQVNISTTLIMEYEAVLKREIATLTLSMGDIDSLLDSLCAIANQHNIFYIWRPTTHDPNDDFLMDLAIEAQADYIISYNKKDLRQVEKFGIVVLTPKEFLQIIGVITP